MFGAIVFESGAPHFRYSVRLNASGMPSTVPPYVDLLARGVRKWSLWPYAYSNPQSAGDGTPFGGGSYNGDYNDLSTRAVPGFLSLQVMVARWIINRTLPAAAWGYNEYSSRFGNALWNVYGQASQVVWDEFWGQPPDGDYAAQAERRVNYTRDMVAYSAAELYFPHAVSFAP